VALTALAANRRYGAYEAKGTLAQWQDGVGSLARGHFLLRLTISAALAGPLLRLAGFEGGGVHVYGPSSTGKTTLVKMAASVWRPGAPLPTWRVTANGLESWLARSSDGFMPLDEIGQAEGKEIANIIYMQANAIGKIRMNRDTTAKDALTWLTLILSSGELPIETKLAEDRKRAHAGHVVRLIDIKADRVNGAFDAMAAWELPVPTHFEEEGG
jgi:putative DNA primase/helicase